ncbi:MAG: OmpA family protein [Bacteroidota bacterium]|nr:OmpA family protein [Bacteroidota bacterium]MDP3144821.1 OmpA family protein [Bacteroidota bacterium]MDP3557808.1 OmpA family protein [Bacteroidota bacterium]
MKKNIILLFVIFCFVLSKGQITIIGHNEVNNSPLLNTTIQVKQDGVLKETINTKSSNNFTIKLNFNHNYLIYFIHPNCQTMFLEIKGDNIPIEKQEINMVHELNIPFVLKTDGDIDTSAFKKAFCKIIFDGNSKMIADIEYNKQFNKTILKKTPTIDDKKENNVIEELPVILSGQISLNKNTKLPISNQIVTLFDKNGKVIKSTSTNRFGAFTFTEIKTSEVYKLKINAKDAESSTAKFSLFNSDKILITESKPANGFCEWILKPAEIKNLINNLYTSNIGGKLVLSSAQQKKFFANKTIYLCNKYNTIIQKTTTNILGAFVFEGIKPDNSFFLGVDIKEVGAGEKLDLLNKDDNYVKFFDTIAGNRRSLKINSNYNELFNSISISEDEMKMNLNAKVYGDQATKPLGRLKIILLNENYVVIDSVLTDDFGAFKFKYLPFLKRFYLSANNSDNVLDAFKNILIYSLDDKLIKIITNEKGKRFIYKPIDAEINKIKDIELEDPWLELLTDKNPKPRNNTIIENILFETNKTDLLPQAKEVLNKVILVLNTNKTIKIEISAHTDSKGTDSDNLKLSQLRAKTALNYITAAGIDAERIISIGYGEEKLLNKCVGYTPCSEIEHAQNRRIEFKILEN